MNPFSHFRVMFLHFLYEVGAPPEKRYRAASTILRLASTSKDGDTHQWLHRALDIVLCGDGIGQLEPGTTFHRQYWFLGHQIATAILKGQDSLNIHQAWFADSYEEALALFSR